MVARAGQFGLRLRQFSADFTKQAQGSSEDFADQVVEAAKQIAPVGETGNYRDSIRKQRSFTVVGAIAGLAGIGQGAWSWTVLSDVPYAERLELGHSKQAPNGVFGVAVSTVRSRYGLG